MSPGMLCRILMVLFVGAVTGCGSMYHLREDLVVQREAKHEFDKVFTHLPKGKHARHYERGWRQAYYDVSVLGKTCPPSLPPQPYWSAKYKNQMGPSYVQQWYAGYNDGAAYARECGMQPVLPWQPSGCNEPTIDACTLPDCGGTRSGTSLTPRGFEAYQPTPVHIEHPPAELIETPAEASRIEPASFLLEPALRRLPAAEEAFGEAGVGEIAD